MSPLLSETIWYVPFDSGEPEPPDGGGGIAAYVAVIEVAAAGIVSVVVAEEAFAKAAVFPVHAEKADPAGAAFALTETLAPTA